MLEKGVSIQMDGTLSPCCQFVWQDDSHTKDYKTFIKVRQEKNELMQSSEQYIPECDWCRKDTENNGESIRDVLNEKVTGTYLELWLNNTCNLACRMCNGFLSSSWLSNIKNNPQLNFDKIYKSDVPGANIKLDNVKDIYNQLDNVRHLKILGGEPFLMKEVHKTLTHVIDGGLSKNIHLDLTTNLTQPISNFWIKTFKSFKSVHVNGSVDGINDRYEYIRPGATFKTVVKNAEIMRGFVETIDNFSFLISCCGQTLSASQNSEIIQFWNKKDIHVEIETIYDPDFMSYKSLHPNLREKFGIKTNLDYDPVMLEKLKNQMSVQDKLHGTNFQESCPELNDL